jgi:hypothetical protein
MLPLFYCEKFSKNFGIIYGGIFSGSRTQRKIFQKILGKIFSRKIVGRKIFQKFSKNFF